MRFEATDALTYIVKYMLEYLFATSSRFGNNTINNNNFKYTF